MVVAAGAVIMSAATAADVIPAVAGIATGLIRFYSRSAAEQTSVAALIAGSAAGGAVLGTAAAAAASVYNGATGQAVMIKSLTGAVAGLTTSSLSAFTMAEITGLAAASNLGLAACLTLGAKDDGNSVSFDCWKPVVREWSNEPSTGRLLWDVLSDKRVKKVTTSYGGNVLLPDIVIENVWSEQFAVEYVLLRSRKLACHAKRLEVESMSTTAD